LSIFDISNNTPVFQKTIQVSQSSANCMKVYSFQWGNYLQIGAVNNYLLYSLANSLFSPEKLYFESDNLRQSQIASIACNGNNVYLLNSEAVTAFSLNRELIQDITSDNLNISVQAGESNTKQIDISGGVPPYTLSIPKQPAKGTASINNLSVRYHSDINDSGTVSLNVLIKDSANQTKEIKLVFSIIPCPEPEAQFSFVPNTGYTHCKSRLQIHLTQGQTSQLAAGNGKLRVDQPSFKPAQTQAISIRSKMLVRILSA